MCPIHFLISFADGARPTLLICPSITSTGVDKTPRFTISAMSSLSQGPGLFHHPLHQRRQTPALGAPGSQDLDLHTAMAFLSIFDIPTVLT
jgi:hypothetical protein